MKRAQDAALGMFAGVLATAAMTASMRLLFAALPKHERYPLPPRLLVEAVLSPPYLPDRCISRDQDLLRARAALLAHVAYGAASGALYGLAKPGGSATVGAAYGVTVWTVSYMGWIPAVGLLRSADQHPERRNALMLIAHVVWGLTLSGALVEMRRGRRWTADCAHE